MDEVAIADDKNPLWSEKEELVNEDAFLHFWKKQEKRKRQVLQILPRIEESESPRLSSQ